MQSERKNKVFVPVTLNMVLEAPSGDNDEIELDGVKVPNIIAVGRLISQTEEQMKIVFEINDGTGLFKVIFYQKEQGVIPLALKNFEYKQGAYAKLFGTVRLFKEEKILVGTHVKKIEKFDEITNHYLQIFTAQ